jgi:hypothetical protein
MPGRTVRFAGPRNAYCAGLIAGRAFYSMPGPVLDALIG